MFFLNEIENYEKLENGIIKQKIVNKIEYNFDYLSTTFLGPLDIFTPPHPNIFH